MNAGTSITRRGFLTSSAAASAAALVAGGVMNSVYAQGNATLKVGLVGCGSRGRGAAGNCVDSSAGVKVWAMGDLFQDQMDETKKMFGSRPKEKYDLADDRCFVGWDAYLKVLATDIDYVILATPPGFRPMMIDAAVKAGKHVFAEKPCGVCPTGVRQVLAATAEAEKKNLGFVIGTQRRHQPSYLEVVKRLQDGAIGDIVAGQVYWTQGGAWVKERQASWTDTEYQLRNWMYYVWLAGDHIVEQHMHQHDVANWVLGSPPKFAIAVGGRQSRTASEYGHIYDHFAVDYEYPSGARVLSVCRQVDGGYGRVEEHFQGTKGRALAAARIFGEKAYKFDPGDEEINPYEQEHKDLVASIRAGKALNEGKRAAESTLTAIMGRMAAYTGKLVTWNMAMNSKLDLTPKAEDLKFGPRPMPMVAIPGKDPLI